MNQICPKCKKPYNKFAEQSCKECYIKDLQIWKCIEIAGTIVGGMMSDPNFEIKKDLLPETVLNIAKALYKKSKEQKFMEW